MNIRPSAYSPCILQSVLISSAVTWSFGFGRHGGGRAAKECHASHAAHARATSVRPQPTAWAWPSHRTPRSAHSSLASHHEPPQYQHMRSWSLFSVVLDTWPRRRQGAMKRGARRRPPFCSTVTADQWFWRQPATHHAERWVAKPMRPQRASKVLFSWHCIDIHAVGSHVQDRMLEVIDVFGGFIKRCN